MCRYPVDPGPCRAAFSKFYYDEALGSCVEFAYGGCHGGPNRFSTVEECEDVCKFEKGKFKVGQFGYSLLTYIMLQYS